MNAYFYSDGRLTPCEYMGPYLMVAPAFDPAPLLKSPPVVQRSRAERRRSARVGRRGRRSALRVADWTIQEPKFADMPLPQRLIGHKLDKPRYSLSQPVETAILYLPDGERVTHAHYNDVWPSRLVI